MRKIKDNSVKVKLDNDWILYIGFGENKVISLYRDHFSYQAYIMTRIDFDACTVSPERFWNELYEALISNERMVWRVGEDHKLQLDCDDLGVYLGDDTEEVGIVNPYTVDKGWCKKLAAAIEGQIFEEEETVEYRGKKYRVCEGLRLEEVKEAHE